MDSMRIIKSMKSKTPKRKYQICKRCVMDTSDKFIQFNSDGICNHCSEYLQKRINGTAYKIYEENALEKLFKKVKSFKEIRTQLGAINTICMIKKNMV